MAKSYHTKVEFDIGGDELTHYAVGDTFPAASEHLDFLIAEGYVGEGKAPDAEPLEVADEPEEKPARKRAAAKPAAAKKPTAAKRSGSRSRS